MKNKGITLVALVITVIVLTILAGISISMLSRRQQHSKASRRCENSIRNSERKRNNRIIYNASIGD